MINEKYNEENTKKVQELTKKLEEEFARRNYLLTQCNHIVAKANREQDRQLLELLQNSDSVDFAQPYPSEDEKYIIYEKHPEKYKLTAIRGQAIRKIFKLLIERAQSVIAAGYDGLGVQDLKDLAFNEYGIDLEENDG